MRRAYLAETAELAYNGRSECGKWGLALGSQAQASMMDIIGISFISMYKVIGPFLFFMSLLLMVWGGLWLVTTVCLRVTNITRYWVFMTFWGTLSQLAVSPFKRIDKVIEEVGEKVGRMLSAEVLHGRTMEGHADQAEEEVTIEGLTKKYPSIHGGYSRHLLRVPMMPG